MCGISGLFLFDSVCDVDARAAVHKMTDALVHRGPDGDGFWSEGPISLGHRRLSIIDVEGGDQPIFSESGQHVLVYNGETYNFKSLKEKLVETHVFKTCTDSEVLVHLYEEYGGEFSDKLDGIFAYAIWDSFENILNIGVDAFGIKPLYYYMDDTIFIFSSELPSLISGLRSVSNVELIADTGAVNSYLKMGWIPAPATLVKNIKKLAPGERLKVRENGVISKVPSIKLNISNITTSENEDVYLSLLENKLRGSVADQLISDVPIGVLLSGGIDSSLITAMASHEVENIKTFSVGFSGHGHEVAAMDESRYARAVSEHFGTEHHELIVDSQLLLEHIDEALSVTGEPIADPAVLPLLLVTRFASEHVKVCLCGDGGDELFGGYLRYVIHPFKNKFQKLPRLVQKLVYLVSRLFPLRPTTGVMEKLRKIRVGITLFANKDYSVGPFSGEYSHWLNVTGLIQNDFCKYPMSDDDVDKCELTNQMPGQLLCKTDRVGMYSSLELRVPFLTQDLVDFSTSIPRNMKVRKRESKYILRRLAQNIMPAFIVNRPKQGFRMPISGWFRNELSDYLMEALGSENIHLDEFISQKKRMALLDGHISGSEEHSIRIWSLLALNSSMKQCFELGKN